jgi:hypothetical protein
MEESKKYISAILQAQISFHFINAFKNYHTILVLSLIEILKGFKALTVCKEIFLTTKLILFPGQKPIILFP